MNADERKQEVSCIDNCSDTEGARVGCATAKEQVADAVDGGSRGRSARLPGISCEAETECGCRGSGSQSETDSERDDIDRSGTVPDQRATGTGSGRIDHRSCDNGLGNEETASAALLIVATVQLADDDIGQTTLSKGLGSDANSQLLFTNLS